MVNVLKEIAAWLIVIVGFLLIATLMLIVEIVLPLGLLLLAIYGVLTLCGFRIVH